VNWLGVETHRMTGSAQENRCSMTESAREDPRRIIGEREEGGDGRTRIQPAVRYAARG